MIAFVSLGFLLVVINAAVSIAVARNAMYERMQKRLQFMVIWLLPILGAAFSWYVLREGARSSQVRGDSGNKNLWWNYPDQNEGNHDHHGQDGGH
jgi:ABC-type nickel/cobalt efflux system permease component RcnA